MKWDSHIQDGRGPPDAGGAQANVGRMQTRGGNPGNRGRQQSDQDQVQNAGHLVRVGHRPRPAQRSLSLVIRRAGTGGGFGRAMERNLMHVGQRMIRDRPVSSGRTHAQSLILMKRGARPVSYYSNRLTPQQSLSP